MFNRELETDIKDRVDRLFDDIREKMPDAASIDAAAYSNGYATVTIRGFDGLSVALSWDRSKKTNDPCD